MNPDLTTLAHVLSWACLVSGSVFCLIGAIGLLRMPDLYTRLHAASVLETLGAGLILLGLMIQSGFSLITVKLLILAALMLFAGPTATHAVARVAMMRGLKPVLADKETGTWKV